MKTKREILFKAKTIRSRKWVEGYYYKILDRVYILWGMTNNYPNMVEVDPDTVCQYTGVNTISGDKIFEDDYLTDIDTCSMIQITTLEGGGLGVIEDGTIYPLDKKCIEDYEVVGNLHNEEGDDE